MARDFRWPQRDRLFLLPPDMREWLGEGHLVWFVLDVVDQFDLSVLRERAKLGGVGRAPLDPGMLLALLVYAYAHGQRSSRQIERLCEVDVAFRVICGNEAPDHTTIARFRSVHESAFAGLFTQVLMLCARAGLGRFGSVAVDGTKIAANASRGVNRGEEALRAEAERIIGEAADVDAAEDAEHGAGRRGDELPAELVDPRSRLARIRRCLQQIHSERAAEAEQARAKAERWEERIAHARRRHAQVRARAAARWQDTEQGRRPSSGRPPVPPDEHVLVRQAAEVVDLNRRRRDAAVEQAARRKPARFGSQTANVTDPESRLMPTRNGFLQAFNAQIVATDDHLILATGLTSDTGDVEQFIPMMTAAVDAAKQLTVTTGRKDIKIDTILADAGYLAEPNLTAPGPDRLIALGKRRATETAARETPTQGPPPPGLAPIDAMGHRLRTEDGIRRYRRRGATVEPAIGSLKDRIGLRIFARRGAAAAHSELQLAATVHNLLKLHRSAATI